MTKPIASKRTRRRSDRSSLRLLKKAPEPPIEITPEKAILCSALATFIRESSLSIKSPYFFLICGNHKKYLFLHTMLSIQKYSALLIGCDLVKCRIMSDGSTKVDCPEERWKRFLERYYLDNDGVGCSEATKGRFYLDALLKNHDYCSKDEGDDYDRSSCKYLMVALRIGKYATPGSAVKATAAIHDPIDPPKFNHKLRTAQRKLFNTISTVLSKFYFSCKSTCYGDVDHNG